MRRQLSEEIVAYSTCHQTTPPRSVDCGTDEFEAKVVRGELDRTNCPFGVHKHGSFDPP